MSHTQLTNCTEKHNVTIPTRLWLRYRRCCRRLAQLDGIPALFMRLYLAPVLGQAGWQKYQYFADTVAWFGADGLQLPLPWLMAWLATSCELVGAVLLVLGLATRWIAIPLAVTMLVAIVTVHWPHGWLAIADASSWFADGTLLSNASVQQSTEKLARAKALLQTHGNYDWLTSSGNLVILNNGIEFAATYLVMLLALLTTGGGRYVSVDFWLARRWQRHPAARL